jgi:cell division protein FtsA
VLDIGAATTNIMVVEEGDVQTVAVIPTGGMHITNDLAVGLRTEIEIAEVVKRNYKYLGEDPKKRPKHIKVVHNKKEYVFPTKDINLIVRARLEELFEDVDKAMGSISRSHRRLPAGITIVGGSANLAGIDIIAKKSFERSARIAYPKNLSGLKEKVARPEFASVVGLMLLDVHKDETSAFGGRFFGGKFQLGAQQATSLVKRLFDRFK